MNKWVVSIFLLVGFSAAASAADKKCIVARSSFVFGSDTSWSMNLSEAEKCIVNMPVKGTSTFEKLELVKQPKFGVVQVTSKTSFVYIKKTNLELATSSRFE